MGAPDDVAARNDWDQISDDFTAVRGLGYVAWYPVAIDAVSMSDGNAVFDAIAAWKYRQQHSEFDARIIVAGAAYRGPLCGQSIALFPVAASRAIFPIPRAAAS